MNMPLVYHISMSLKHSKQVHTCIKLKVPLDLIGETSVDLMSLSSSTCILQPILLGIEVMEVLVL